MKERTAALLLVLTSAIWGFTFVFQNQAASVIGAGFFNGIRMIVGFIVLLPLVIPIFKRHKKDKAYMKTLFGAGLSLGLVVSLASYTQQLGVGMTSAGKAGFLTSLYTLFVPVLAMLTGKKTNMRTWICVLIGLCGAFLLSINGDKGIETGDVLLFVCAIFFAVQIIIIDEFGKTLEGIDLSAVQFLGGGIISLLLAFFSKEPIDIETVKLATIPILYSGICSCGIAYTLQIIAQKHLHPTKATLIFSLESVWACIGGALILKERMTVKESIGCLLLFAAVVISQIPSKKIRNK